MPAVWGSMGNNSRSIAGNCKVSQVDKPEPDGGKDSQKGKDFLEGCLRIFRSRRAFTDQVNSIACRKNIGGIFCKLSIAANRFCRFFAVLSGGEEGRPGVLFPGTKPETVHEVIIRAKWREILNRGKATQAGKGNGVRENIPDPCGEAGFCVSAVEKQEKKDEGTQDLRLVFSRSPLRGIKLREIIQ